LILNRLQLAGELLTAFFKYYTDKFDFTRDAGSVRKGKVLYVQTGGQPYRPEIY